ncbi:hypothetical protein CLAIMM_14219 [Cladophialophora immunda]|nr:hypothetical protein CLAIMM_14219 [Cladophialophora immunda]
MMDPHRPKSSGDDMVCSAVVVGGSSLAKFRCPFRNRMLAAFLTLTLLNSFLRSAGSSNITLGSAGGGRGGRAKAMHAPWATAGDFGLPLGDALVSRLPGCNGITLFDFGRSAGFDVVLRLQATMTRECLGGLCN